KPGEICEGHATTTVELLKKENFGDEEMYRAILGHHDGMGVTSTSLIFFIALRESSANSSNGIPISSILLIASLFTFEANLVS
ncbi:hypothetical protein ACTPD5_22690, partial [Clostridioides difficile]